MYVSSGLLRAFTIEAREGSVVNPRYPAPVNTYNPTIHAVVDAIFEALSHVIPGRVRADGCGSRSIIIGGRSTYTGKGYVQYEIVGGGAGARASSDGASGTTRQPDQRQDRAGRDHRERVPDPRAALRADPRLRRRRRVSRRARHPARISQSRRGALLDPLRQARDRAERVRRRRRTAAPATSGSIPDSDKAKRLPTRYADYPLQAGDVFRLDTPGGGGYGDPLARDPARVLRRRARGRRVDRGGGGAIRRGDQREAAGVGMSTTRTRAMKALARLIRVLRREVASRRMAAALAARETALEGERGHHEREWKLTTAE